VDFKNNLELFDCLMAGLFDGYFANHQTIKQSNYHL